MWWLLGGLVGAAVGNRLVQDHLIDPNNPQKFDGAHRVVMEQFRDFEISPRGYSADGKVEGFRSTEATVARRAIRALPPEVRIDIAARLESGSGVEEFLRRYVTLKVAEYRQNPDKVPWTIPFAEVAKTPSTIGSLDAAGGLTARFWDNVTSRVVNRSTSTGAALAHGARNRVREIAGDELADGLVGDVIFGSLEHGINFTNEVVADPIAVGSLGLGGATRLAAMGARRFTASRLSKEAVAAVDMRAAQIELSHGAEAAAKFRESVGAPDAAKILVDNWVGKPETVAWLERTQGMGPSDLLAQARHGGSDLHYDDARLLARAESLEERRRILSDAFLESRMTAAPVDGLQQRLAGNLDSIRYKAPILGWSKPSWGPTISLVDSQHLDFFKDSIRYLYNDFGPEEANKLTQQATDAVVRNSPLKASKAEAAEQLSTFRLMGDIWDNAFTSWAERRVLSDDQFAKLRAARLEASAMGKARIGGADVPIYSSDGAMDKRVRDFLGLDKTSDGPLSMVAEVRKSVADWRRQLNEQAFNTDANPSRFVRRTDRPWMPTQLQYSMKVPGYWDLIKLGGVLDGTGKGLRATTNTLDGLMEIARPMLLAKPSTQLKFVMDDFTGFKFNPNVQMSWLQVARDWLASAVGKEVMPPEVSQAIFRHQMPSGVSGEHYAHTIGGTGVLTKDARKALKKLGFTDGVYKQYRPEDPRYRTALYFFLNDQFARHPIVQELLGGRSVKQAAEAWSKPSMAAAVDRLPHMQKIRQAVEEGKVPSRAMRRALRTAKQDAARLVETGVFDEIAPKLFRGTGEQQSMFHEVVGGNLRAAPERLQVVTVQRLREVADDIISREPNVSVRRLAGRIGVELKLTKPAVKKLADTLEDAAVARVGKDPGEISRILGTMDLAHIIHQMPDEIRHALETGGLSMATIDRAVDKHLRGEIQLPETVEGVMMGDNWGDLSEATLATLAKKGSDLLAFGGILSDKWTRRVAWNQTMRREIERGMVLAEGARVPIHVEDIARIAEWRTSREMFKSVDVSANRTLGDEWLLHFIPFFDAQTRYIRRWVRLSTKNPAGVERFRAVTRWMQNAGFGAEDEHGNLVMHVPGGYDFAVHVGKVSSLTPGLLPFGVSILPGLHPMIKVGMKDLLDTHPGLEGFKNFVNGGFEPQGDTFISQMANSMSAGWMKHLADANTLDPNDEQVGNALISAFEELYYQGRDITDPIVQAEGRRMARALLLTKAALSFASPYSTEVQPWVAAIREDWYELRSQHGPEEGAIKFLEKWGPRAEIFMQAKSEPALDAAGDPLARGLATTADATRFYESNRELFQKYPLAAGFLTLAGSSLASKREELDAYRDQLKLGVLEKKLPLEFVADAMYRMGNRYYYDELLPAAEKKAADGGYTAEQFDHVKRVLQQKVDERFPGWLTAKNDWSSRAAQQERSKMQLRSLVNDQDVTGNHPVLPVQLFLADYDSALARVRSEYGLMSLESSRLAPVRAALAARFRALDARYDSEILRGVYDYLFRYELED